MILLHANNKITDHGLINTFVIGYLGSIEVKLASCQISIFLLVSVAEQTGFLKMRHVYPYEPGHVIFNNVAF